jgi:hypothetical protein
VLYLFDANVLITASNTYYPIDQVPEFWEWLQFQGQAGKIKLPLEIMEEILAGKKDDDPLLTWMKDAANKAALLLDEAVDADLVNTVVEKGYATDLTDDQLEEIGRDPFLVAYSCSLCHVRRKSVGRHARGFRAVQEASEPQATRCLHDVRYCVVRSI